MPEELDWYIWRPVVHEKRLCTMLELEQHYSLDDLKHFHMVCDVCDALSAKIAAEAKRRADEANPT